MTRRLLHDRRGTTIVEFAVIAPVMCLLIMGLSDMAYQSYMQSMLTGAMQKAGRDSGIQGGSNKGDLIDAQVIGVLRNINKDATYASTRKSYASFGQVAPEQFDDNNTNNQYDKVSECFTDVNGNGVWDADPGTQGQGGANDVVVYQMTVSYPRLFPLAGLMGLPAVQKISSTTVLKNQPYAQQNSYAAKRICP